jgi:DNA polymerase III epsilon subunit-like protein
VTAPIVWVDVETTGLSAEDHEIWEVALIEADGNERLWHLPVDLGKADAVALRIGRFYDRSPQVTDHDTGHLTPARAFAHHFSRLTAGKYLCGAVPSFDEERLRRLLRANGACPDWNHRLICVETLAAGAKGWPVPCGLAKTAELLGIPVDRGVLHTVLGDARLARDVYKHIIPEDPKEEEA